MKTTYTTLFLAFTGFLVVSCQNTRLTDNEPLPKLVPEEEVVVEKPKAVKKPVKKVVEKPVVSNELSKVSLPDVGAIDAAPSLPPPTIPKPSVSNTGVSQPSVAPPISDALTQELILE